MYKIGCYAVNVWIDGQPRQIVLDDKFPYDQYDEQWAFCRSSNKNEIWLLLLEKVWSKVYGSYQRIEFGIFNEVF